MRRFADLFTRLARSTGTADTRAALVDYFRSAPAEDAAWALYLLVGGKVGGAKARIAGPRELREWMERHGNADLDGLRGRLSATQRGGDPGAFLRALYRAITTPRRS